MPDTLFPYGKDRTAKRYNKPSAPVEFWRPVPAGAFLLAIDPSIANCGWAIVQNTQPNPTRIDSGIFHPIAQPDLNRYDHLAKLLRQRVQLAREAGNDPTQAIIEIPSGGQWSTSATQLMAYSRAIGVIEATLYGLKIHASRVYVNEWKGSGKKEHTIRVVRQFFQYEPRDNNEADALGLAMWLCSQTPRRTV